MSLDKQNPINVDLLLPCPVCSVSGFYTKHIVERNAEVFRIMCNECNTVYFDREPPYNPLYDCAYNSIYHRIGDIKKAGIMATTIAEVADIFYIDPVILEAGTGNGLTVFLLQQMRIKSFGVDLDESQCLLLQEDLKINVFCSKFETLSSPIGFDIIYSSHVIEHCQRPLAFFQKASSLLNNGGMFILDTPDTAYITKEKRRWHHFETRDPYEHCCLLGEKGVRTLADKAGLKVAILVSQAIYGSLLAVMYKGTLGMLKLADTHPNNLILQKIKTPLF